ncbi:MAG TPA: PQQ-dependent sugar dehydrogenase [Pseudonocardiaceae bacterium]
MAVRALLAGSAALGLLLSGCADFPDERPGDWRDKPQLTPQAAPDPRFPGDRGPGGSGGGDRHPAQPPSSIPPPQGCTDYHPAVVATCLDRVSAVAVLPSGQVAFVAERTTGRILRVEDDKDPVEVATIPVDAQGDGGLTGLALSPTYHEDELIYAYVTTPTDNRVVRLSPGDKPKPVLTGIPRGATGNRGALALDRKGALLVATGDAGNPAAAANPSSLAGKVLRINANGEPATGNPNPASPVLAGGLHAPGGVCTTLDGSAIWVTDRAGERDVLHRVQQGVLTTPVWNWPDRPGVGGCAAWPDLVMVFLDNAAAVANVPLNQDGAVTGQPELSMQDTFGRFSGADLSPNGQEVWVGTVNKAGGQPVSSDDRVIVIPRTSSSGGGRD